MKKVKTLKDGSEVIIRPLTNDDVEKSFQFFQELPPADREYLRVDVTKHDLVEQRIKSMKEKNVKRIAALCNDSGKITFLYRFNSLNFPFRFISTTFNIECFTTIVNLSNRHFASREGSCLI